MLPSLGFCPARIRMISSISSRTITSRTQNDTSRDSSPLQTRPSREFLGTSCCLRVRALNKFLGEYAWDDEELNLKRIEELQHHNETRWSKDGFVVIDDTLTEKPGEEIPKVGTFYGHGEGEFIWGQNLVYSYYTDDKTGYPPNLRRYEKDADTASTKIELATDPSVLSTVPTVD